MGLFDDIQCNYPLPWPEKVGHWFQSKSLECYCEKYEITADGRLMFRKTVREFEKNADALLGFYHVEVSHDWVHLSGFTGEVEIHDLEESDVGQDWWYSIQFWVRDGIVKDMVCNKRGLDCSSEAQQAGDGAEEET